MRLSTSAIQFVTRSLIMLCVKILGGIVRIPIFQMLGSEGVGLYQMVYSTYGLLFTIATGGYPTVLTLRTAGDFQRGLRYFWLSLLYLVPFLVILCFLIHLGAGRLALLFDEPQMSRAFLYLSPVLAIVPLVNLIRGLFQGLEMYGVVAVSELIEQAVRVTVMLLLVIAWIKESLHQAVGGALVGAWSGAVAALLFLSILLLRELKASGLSSIGGWHSFGVSSAFQFANESLIIMGTRIIIPLSEFLDALIIPHRLQASGLSVSQATAVYGQFTGMAASVVYLPSLVTASLSHISASKLSWAWLNKKKERFLLRVERMLTLGWFWGLGSAFFIWYYHHELAMILFHNASAGIAIAFLSIMPLLVGLRELTTTILWVMGKSAHTIYGLVAGLLCAVTAGYTLIAIPELRYIGTALELMVLEAVSLGWNSFILCKHRVVFLPYAALFAKSLLLLFVLYICFYWLDSFIPFTSLSPELNSSARMLLSFLLLGLLVLLATVKKH